MKRPFIVTLLAIIFCIVTVCLFGATLVTLFHSSHGKNTATMPVSVFGRSFFIYLTFLSTLLTRGLFRFQRWAIVSVGMLTGFLGIYTLVSLILIRHESTKVWIWTCFLALAAISLYLLFRLNLRMGKSEKQRIRPFGISVLAGFSCICLPVYPVVFLNDFSRHVPAWQLASQLFDLGLCISLVLGLWKLWDWSRILTEITSYLVPLVILPSFLGINNHKPITIAIAVTSLIYAIWSILYLKDPDVVKAFEGNIS